jgi:hypothetical protein
VIKGNYVRVEGSLRKGEGVYTSGEGEWSE